MTFSTKLFTSAMFAIVTLIAAFVLSLGTPAYDGTIILQSQHSTAQAVTNAPMMMIGAGDTFYYHTSSNDPVKLCDCGGQVDTLESFSIIASDMMYTIWSSVFGTN